MFEETNYLATEATCRSSCFILAVCTYIMNRLLRCCCIIGLLRKVFSFRRDENDRSEVVLVTGKVRNARSNLSTSQSMLFIIVLWLSVSPLVQKFVIFFTLSAKPGNTVVVASGNTCSCIFKGSKSNFPWKNSAIAL